MYYCYRKKMMSKKIFVEKMKEGDRFEELFLIKNVKLGETRAGKPYLVVTVMDKSGEVSGPVWDNVEPLRKICVVGQVVEMSGSVQSYRDTPQLRIDTVKPVAQNKVDLGDFYPASPRNIREMADELQDIVLSVSNSHLKKLLSCFFKKGASWQNFQQAPAAKGIHHAYIGGLLEHSLSVARAADFLSRHYEGIDRSLLISGALLHDIGKLEELKVEGGLVEYTARGRLKGHLVIGSEMVGKAAATIDDFPEQLLEQLQHLILSHHGRQEFGSPTVPMTVEAFMLSFLDDLDAKMNITEQLRRKMDKEELSWTDYQRSLERYLFLGGYGDGDSANGGNRSNNIRQPSLF